MVRAHAVSLGTMTWALCQAPAADAAPHAIASRHPMSHIMPAPCRHGRAACEQLRCLDGRV